MVVVHGYGSSRNTFIRYRVEWQNRYGLKLMSCWFEGSDADNGIICDHAAMNETSLVMHFYPELAMMEYLPTDRNTELRGVAGKDPRIHA
jgi:hypothetical protein